MLKNLLNLQVNSPILFDHFKIIILLVKKKTFPDLTKRLYDMLI